MSQIRCELADQLNIDALEKVLFTNWRTYISSQNQVPLDATCYERELRYPTPQKLLWEAVD